MPRLLLVEDNQHIQRIFRERLQREGFQVITADDGEAGWRAAQELHPDLILLDIMLPKMDGLELLRHAHEHPVLSRTPIFMLSNRGTTSDVQLAKTLGARHFFTKGSSTLHDIVWHIRNACGFKKILICTRPDLAPPIISALEHPRVLCAVCTVFAEAIGTAERSTPEAVVVDARPSRVNAINLLQHLKSNATTRSVAVVAINDSGQTIHRADAVVEGVCIPTDLRPIVSKYLKIDEAEPATAEAFTSATA